MEDKNTPSAPTIAEKIMMAITGAGLIGLLYIGVKALVGNKNKVAEKVTKGILEEPGVLDIAFIGVTAGCGILYKIEKDHLEKKNKKIEAENEALKQKSRPQQRKEETWVSAERVRSETSIGTEKSL